MNSSQAGIALGAQRLYVDAPVSLTRGTLLNPARHIFLVFSDIQFQQSPGAYYEIYLNLPIATRPGLSNNIFYVGNLSFFAIPHSPYSERFDITNIFQRQLEVGLARTNVAHLTLVLQGVPAAPGTPITMAEGANARISGVVVTDAMPGRPQP
jgi:hypothetical protein